jgi:isopentenyldiphosphate isomerase
MGSTSQQVGAVVDGGQIRFLTRLRHLSSATERADHCLDRDAYLVARRLFAACLAEREGLEALVRLAPEYGRSEFLLCVDGVGRPAPLPGDVLDDYREVSSQHAGFTEWFQEAAIAADGSTVLLVARWLCHLAGFRHRTIHLFIDHPTASGCTLVQVRGVSKAHFPGCFDVPAAGHVAGLQAVEDALFEELTEELGLAREDLGHIWCLGTYTAIESLDEIGFRDVEYRTVFQSRLQNEGILKVRFVDREVAALAIFRCAEVAPMIDAFPGRVASGLAKSWPMYLAHVNGRP